jgi:hypothetical protein
MRKYLAIFLILYASQLVGLENFYYQTNTSITPIDSDRSFFLADIHIERVDPKLEFSEVIAAPKIPCVKGKPSEFRIESEDHADQLLIRVFIPDEPDRETAHLSIMLKENHEILLSQKSVITISKVSF